MKKFRPSEEKDMAGHPGDLGDRVPWEEHEVDDAARQAARIGGYAGDEYLDPTDRPLIEAGEGEAEGFELAEEDLTHSGLTSTPRFAASTPTGQADRSRGRLPHAHRRAIGELDDHDRLRRTAADRRMSAGTAPANSPHLRELTASATGYLDRVAA